MHTFDRVEVGLFGLTLGCFAAGGVTNVALTEGVLAILPMGFVVVGVYALARLSNRLSRARLARLSFVTWLAFLAIAGVSVLGPVGIISPVTWAVGETVLGGLTWALVLTAGVSSVFLAFREYGTTIGQNNHEEVIDGDVEY